MTLKVKYRTSLFLALMVSINVIDGPVIRSIPIRICG